MDIKKAIGRALVPAFLLASVGGTFAATEKDKTPKYFNSSQEFIEFYKRKKLSPIFTAESIKPIGNGEFLFTPILTLTNHQTKEWITIKEAGNKALITVGHGTGFTNYTNTYNALSVSGPARLPKYCALPEFYTNARQIVFEADNADGTATIFMTGGIHSSKPNASAYQMMSINVGESGCIGTVHSDFKVIGQQHAPKLTPQIVH